MKFLVDELFRCYKGRCSFLVVDPENAIVLYKVGMGEPKQMDLPYVYFDDTSPKPMFYHRTRRIRDYSDFHNNAPPHYKSLRLWFMECNSYSGGRSAGIHQHNLAEFHRHIREIPTRPWTPSSKHYVNRNEYIWRMHKYCEIALGMNNCPSQFVYNIPENKLIWDAMGNSKPAPIIHYNNSENVMKLTVGKCFTVGFGDLQRVVSELSLSAVVARFSEFFHQCYGQIPEVYNVLRFLKNLDEDSFVNVPQSKVYTRFNGRSPIDCNFLWAAFHPLVLDKVKLYAEEEEGEKDLERNTFLDSYGSNMREEVDTDEVMTDAPENHGEEFHFGFSYDEIKDKVIVQTSFYTPKTTAAILELVLQRPYPQYTARLGTVDLLGHVIKISYCSDAYCVYANEAHGSLLSAYTEFVIKLTEEEKKSVCPEFVAFLYLRWICDHEIKNKVKDENKLQALRRFPGVNKLIRNFRAKFYENKRPVQIKKYDFTQEHHPANLDWNIVYRFTKKSKEQPFTYTQLMKFIRYKFLWMLNYNTFYKCNNNKEVIRTIIMALKKDKFSTGYGLSFRTKNVRKYYDDNVRWLLDKVC